VRTAVDAGTKFGNAFLVILHSPDEGRQCFLERVKKDFRMVLSQTTHSRLGRKKIQLIKRFAFCRNKLGKFEKNQDYEPKVFPARTSFEEQRTVLLGESFWKSSYAESRPKRQGRDP